MQDSPQILTTTFKCLIRLQITFVQKALITGQKIGSSFLHTFNKAKHYISKRKKWINLIQRNFNIIPLKVRSQLINRKDPNLF